MKLNILDTIIHAVKFGCHLLRSLETALVGPISSAEVERMLAAAAKSTPELDWKNSIVDLMKVLHLDSSLRARKTLARELVYPGQLDGSAEMNTWLHAQVMDQIGRRIVEVP